MNAFLSLFQSRKTMRVFLGAFVIFGSLWIMWPTLTTPMQKQVAYTGALATFAGLLGIDIHGIATEDAATKSGNPQVNVGSTVDNTTKPADPLPVTVQPPAAPKPAAMPLTADQLPALAVAMLNELAKQQAFTAARAKQQAALADTIASGKIAP